MNGEHAQQKQALGQIYDSIRDAEWVLTQKWDLFDRYRRTDSADEDDWEAVAEAQQLIARPLEQAFKRSLVFLESRSLNETRRSVADLYERASQPPDHLWEFDENELSPVLVHALELRTILDAVEVALQEPELEPLVRELHAVLTRTAYSISDQNAFGSPPSGETDVHNRIEAILKCFYPDCIHKPAVDTFLKNFEPDTGIPSLKTLIEYKFADKAQKARNQVDQLFADVVGYTSERYDRLIFVLYETGRFFSEEQWTQALEEKTARLVEVGGVGKITAIVLPGVPPVRK